MRRGGSLCWSPHSSARSSRAQRGVRRAGRRVWERATRDQARYPGLSRISMHCVNGRRLDCHAAATAAAPSCARARTGAGGRRRQHGSAAAPTKSTSAKHERQARAPSTTSRRAERQARRKCPREWPQSARLRTRTVRFHRQAHRTAGQNSGGRTNVGLLQHAVAKTQPVAARQRAQSIEQPLSGGSTLCHLSRHRQRRDAASRARQQHTNSRLEPFAVPVCWLCGQALQSCAHHATPQPSTAQNAGDDAGIIELCSAGKRVASIHPHSKHETPSTPTPR